MSTARRAMGAAVGVALAALAAAGGEPDPPRGIGRWDALAYGHHRAVVRVEAPADAVLAHVPWRRPDHKPEAKEIVVIDAATGARVANVARASVTREAGDLVFQPQTAPGDYYVYFLPFLMTGRSNYPTIDYPKPVDWADTEWQARHGLTRGGARRRRVADSCLRPGSSRSSRATPSRPSRPWR